MICPFGLDQRCWGSEVLLNPQNGFCLLNVCPTHVLFSPLAVVAQQEPKYFAERWC